MPRCGRLRSFIREYHESPRAEKLSFIPPFLVLAIEIILIKHAIDINENYVIILTSLLLLLSILEIIFVTKEIHDHYRINNLDKQLTIRLDDFILKKKTKNVKEIVEEFLKENPKYKRYRNKIYRISCQIMETHSEELWEETLKKRLKDFISKNDYKSVKKVISKFTEKYPEYEKEPSKIYPVAAELMENPQD